MTLRKDEAIKSILKDYEKLANLVLAQLDEVEKLILKGVISIDDESRNLLAKNEKKINKLEVKISEDIIDSIALYQPVASEIRKLIACYRIVISLERIVDLAISSIKSMRHIDNQEVYNSLSGFIGKMTHLSTEMARNSMLSFINQDMDLALLTIKSENIVDELNHKMYKKVADKASSMAENDNILISFINAKEMVSSIERIADHAANIAEASYYSYEGKDIRHKRNQN
jgi:phosphate transport system protein